MNLYSQSALLASKETFLFNKEGLLRAVKAAVEGLILAGTLLVLSERNELELGRAEKNTSWLTQLGRARWSHHRENWNRGFEHQEDSYFTACLASLSISLLAQTSFCCGWSHGCCRSSITYSQFQVQRGKVLLFFSISLFIYFYL